jgi:hypothetical protein
MPTRRLFLCNCSLLAAAVSVSPPIALGALSPPNEVPLDSISLEAFVQQVNTIFTVATHAGSMIRLELSKVHTPAPLKAAVADSPDSGNEKFTLTFRGRLDQPMEQDTYRFSHPALGSFSLFIVPIVVLDLDYCYYEAVFNRLAQNVTPNTSPEPVLLPKRGTFRKLRSN